jgi:PAS domain S-box-containing protein
MSGIDDLGKALLASASDAIIATDREGRITFWNPGAERIFGFCSVDAVGQPLDLIIPDNLRARHWTGYRQAMATGESRYGQGDLLSVPGLTKDCRRISVEFTIVMLRDGDNRPTGTAAILRDVTRRFEEVRELRRKLADLTRTK